MCFRSASLRGAVIVCSAYLVLVSGCGARGAAGLSLDEKSAREALTTFLDTWKAGGTVESLKDKDPSIVGRDFDWEGGKKLVSYSLGEDLLNDGANLETLVDLTLSAEGAAETVVHARYTVGTEPVITVFRYDDEMMGSE